jgi:hypothetical protein
MQTESTAFAAEGTLSNYWSNRTKQAHTDTLLLVISGTTRALFARDSILGNLVSARGSSSN